MATEWLDRLKSLDTPKEFSDFGVDLLEADNLYDFEKELTDNNIILSQDDFYPALNIEMTNEMAIINQLNKLSGHCPAIAGEISDILKSLTV